MHKPIEKGSRLAGKVAVVSGAGAGIGQGCALLFVAQGARVFAVDINLQAAEATVAKAKDVGERMTALQADLTDAAAVRSLVTAVEREAGQVDILLNAAATAVFKWIDDLSIEEWRFTLAAELDSVFLMTHHFWPLLKASGRASIINFASANAWMALNGSPALAHCAGKGGVLAMTRQLAMEGAPHGIRANSLSPGLIVTDATRAHMARDPGFEEAVLQQNMIKRLGQPEDIAWCATWLASDESTFVTAADFSIDGGARHW